MNELPPPLEQGSAASYYDEGVRLGLPAQVLYPLSGIVLRDDQTYDPNALDHAAMMYRAGVDSERIELILQQSLDLHKDLNIEKFFALTRPYHDKFGLSRLDIHEQIKDYKSRQIKIESQVVTAKYAFDTLQAAGLPNDLIMEIMGFIAIKKDLPLFKTQLNKKAIDEIAFLVNKHFPRGEIIPLLQKIVDSENKISMDRLNAVLSKPEQEIAGRRLAPSDGTSKIRVNMRYLAKISQNMKILIDNNDKIIQLSDKYKKDNLGFADAFYHFYTQQKGYADLAPKFTPVQAWEASNQNSVGISTYTGQYMGIFGQNLRHKDIVNNIAHELTHFEVLMLYFHTQGIGIEAIAKYMTLGAIIDNNGGYEKYFKQDIPKKANVKSVILTPKEISDWGYHKIGNSKVFKQLYPEFLGTLDTPFYRKIMASDKIRQITPDDQRYGFINELADSEFMIRDPLDTFTYLNSLHERMAWSIGNASGEMFENVILNTHDDKSQILSFDKAPQAIK